MNGRKILDLSVSTYVELWNMSDQTINGSLQVSYETKYNLQIPPNPPITLGDLFQGRYVRHDPVGRSVVVSGVIGNVSLGPNNSEYRVFKCGTVKYSFDAGDASAFISSPLSLSGETLSVVSGAGYRMLWNGQLVDQSRELPCIGILPI